MSSNVEEALDGARAALLEGVQKTDARAQTGGLSLIVFSGEFDKWMAAFTLATTTAALGKEVTMFFAFWGLLGLREKRRYRGKSLVDRCLTLFLGRGVERTTRMNSLGMGSRIFRRIMKRKGVAGLEELVQTARDLGVRLVACEMSMDVLGVTREELVDGVEFGGAATCIADMCQQGQSSLFI